MLASGKSFLLTQATLAVVDVDGKRRAKFIPAGTILPVLPGYRVGDVSVLVQWGDQSATMFAVDLQARGVEIKTRGAH